MAKIPRIVPKDSLIWLAKKRIVPGFDYRDVWREEHSNAFTVAKMTQLDLLADVKSLLEDNLADGLTFREFQAALRPQLIQRGWWGRKLMTDPQTGQTHKVQLGSDRRLRVIYDTNMRTARAAGQWERIQRTKRAMPYLLYTLGPSLVHRPEHERWKDICLPVDHDFWKTHFTPNGWGCKCTIRQVSRHEYSQMDERGSITTTAPDDLLVTWTNRRTGETEQIPEGIDPGWNYNPGINRTANVERQLSEKQQAFQALYEEDKNA